MPASRPGNSVRKRKPKVRKPDRLFSRFQEAATRYELEKTAALAAAFAINPDPNVKS